MPGDVETYVDERTVRENTLANAGFGHVDVAEFAVGVVGACDLRGVPIGVPEHFVLSHGAHCSAEDGHGVAGCGTRPDAPATESGAVMGFPPVLVSVRSRSFDGRRTASMRSPGECGGACTVLCRPDGHEIGRILGAS